MTIDTIYRFNRFWLHLSSYFNRFELSASERAREIEWRMERQRTRRQLLTLNEQQLMDIGVTRAQAEAEAKRDFWD